MAKRRTKGDYFRCPHCGAKVRRGALACPKCGSDDETGWSENADQWQADIPAGYADDDDFDYDEFVADEFPQHATRRAKGAHAKWVWGIVVVLVCLALLLLLCR